MKEQPVVYVGCDDGYACIKLAYCEFGGAVKTLSFPSRISTGTRVSGTGGEASDLVYETNSKIYTVLPPGKAENTRVPEYPTSDLNRVLVHHALKAAGLWGRRIDLVTGLPPGDFYRGKSGFNDVLIESKNASIKKLVRPIKPTGAPPSFVRAEVCSEAMAAVIDQMFNDRGEQVAEVKNAWAVVDIGGRTTDVLTIVGQPHLGVGRDGTGSENIGVMDAIDRLTRRLVDQYGVENASDIVGLDKALQTGKLTMWTEEHDVSGHVCEVIEEVGSEILRAVQVRLKGAASMDKILFVGGGAACFKDLIKAFPSATLAHDPQFANARGMMKYAITSRVD